MVTATYTTEVDVDVDLEDFDVEDLARTLEEKGFAVIEKEHLVSDLRERHGYTVVTTLELEQAIEYLQRGDKQEGFILLERALPELKGLLL